MNQKAFIYTYNKFWTLTRKKHENTWNLMMQRVKVDSILLKRNVHFDLQSTECSNIP